ncbi:hypothetical protein DSM112329_00219 [Paraconexibacter sp. AEG42_29]|uniref:DUF4190 domain-containing protein n=1 Tax=Paraconexibacter sp. AEG42_29 TaxID=2997339 RepID=A0AAU7AP31_9ACTN
MDRAASHEPDPDDGLRDRARRLRWRLSGAWQLPAFAVCTVLGTVTLHQLPIAGEGTGVVAAFLLAGMANLVVLAVAGPAGGWLLRRRSTSLPKAIAVDRAASLSLVGMLGLLLALGVLHHGAVVDASGNDERQLAAARAWVQANGEPEFVRHLDRANVWKPADFLYRTCFAGDDPAKNLCLYVDLSGERGDGVVVTRDNDQQPNAVLAGVDNPGRRGR